MANNDRAAHAAGNRQSNDSGHIEEHIDDLVSMFIRNAPGRMKNEELRLRVLARAFAVEYVECRYDGDPFVCLEEAEAFAGEEIVTRILDVDPSLYDDVDIDDLDDTDDDSIADDITENDPIDEGSDPFDGFCESEFCDGCCDECPIDYACIPVFVIDGLEMRVVLRRRNSDA